MNPVPARVHGFLIDLLARMVRLLPRSVHSALDAWSSRVARKRALRRQQALRKD